jgi:hypothetical protein
VEGGFEMKKNVHGVLFFLVAALMVASSPAHATTYYVRTDGGTATQCTGTTNAAYPGSGSAKACAFNHPYWAIPPGSASSRLRSGDTLVIGRGSYMMGYGAPNATNNVCNTPGTFQCTVKNIPSGSDASHLTTITGDCSAPPELWATGGSQEIFELRGVHDIAIKCLDLTDHSSCIVDYPLSGQGVSACAKSYPYGEWGYKAIYASNVKNLTLSDLNIHGFAEQGIQAGGFSGTNTFTRVKVVGGPRAGWNEDLGGGGSSINTGTQTFTDLTIAWTGCSENYPADGGYKGCFGPNQGGYGDAFSIADTGGNYVFIRPVVYNNTSDGLDLLHGDGTAFVTVDGGYFANNVGNDVKIGGSGTVTNNVMVNYCTWFADAGYPAGNGSCRAGGGELAALKGNNAIQTWAYNTIISNGSGLFVGDSTWANSTDTINLFNNIFIGVARNGQQPFFDWYADGGNYPQTVNHVGNIVWHTRSTACDNTGIICKDPQLTNETLAAFSARPLPSSPAINNANTVYTVTHDQLGNQRPVGGGYDIGAIEYVGQPWLAPDQPPVPPAGGGGSSQASADALPIVAPSIADDPVAENSPVEGSIHSTRVFAGHTYPPADRYYRAGVSNRFAGFVARERIARPSPTAGGVIGAGSTPPRSGESAAPAVGTATAAVKSAISPAPAVSATRSYLLTVLDWFRDIYQRSMARL